ncbi:tRNA (adenosine(37)-N6)-threonylcarbamoyltransferase complex ATPase subunit type 1 TsaE [bacterium]|nr:tRNA (adenosine(37)-N6)-threonylcarbamoyltransferase complex ATPase subunit type 1 TsaE [bacterium]
MISEVEIITHSAEESLQFGKKIAEKLSPGDVVAFYGGLGVGKTTMIKGMARAFGIDSTEVSSPTFALIHEYPGVKTIYHIDLYRLDKKEEIAQLGLWELFDGEGISLVEWAEKGELFLPERTIRVNIQSLGDNERKIVVQQQSRGVG